MTRTNHLRWFPALFLLSLLPAFPWTAVAQTTADQEPTVEAVREAQMALYEMGYLDSGIDGRLGPQTSKALREFQKDRGLVATGRLDARTLEELRAAAATGHKKGSGGGFLKKIGGGIGTGVTAGARGVAKGATAGGTATADAAETAGKATAKATTVAAVETAGATKTAAVKTREFVVGEGTADPQQVRQAQEILRQEGFYQGPVDGLFGPATEEALRQYQLKKSLKVSGRLDSGTLQSMGIR